MGTWSLAVLLPVPSVDDNHKLKAIGMVLSHI